MIRTRVVKYLWSCWVLALLLVVPVHAGAEPVCIVNETFKFLTATADLRDYFGTSMDASSDTMIVGAPGRQYEDARDGLGAAYILDISGPIPRDVAELYPPTELARSYGSAVSISGTTIAIGAPEATDTSGNNSAGRVYTYDLIGGEWQLTDLLVPTVGPLVGVLFGSAVELAEDPIHGGQLLFIGTPRDSELYTRHGSCYIYRRMTPQDHWELEHRVVPNVSTGTNQQLGHAIDYHDGNLVVTAPYEDNTTGVIYRAWHDGLEWNQQRLAHSDSANFDAAGMAVAIWGDTIFVGAPYFDQVPFDAIGGVMIFKRNESGHWLSAPPLINDPFRGGQLFGSSIAVNDSFLLVGAIESSEHADEGGQCFAFRRVGGQYQLITELLSSDMADLDRLSTGLVLDGPVAYVSSPNQNRNTIYAGAIYRFGSLADCDQDGTADICEPQPQPFNDCNLTGIDDSMEIACGIAIDLDENGIPDECDPDCNSNDIPDALEILATPSLDCNDDGVLDSCQPDTNGNDIPDVCEALGAPELDCDANGVFDAVELAGTYQTGIFSPIGNYEVYPLYVDSFKPFETDMLLRIQGSGGFEGITGQVAVFLDWTHYILLTPDTSCGQEFNIELRFLKETVNAALADDNQAIFAIIMDNSVAHCSESYVSASLTPVTAQDCNQNGALDICDISYGSGTDCNENLLLDSCEVAEGAEDCDGNKILDSCETRYFFSESNTFDSLRFPDIHSVVFNELPDAGSDVEVRVMAAGDLGALTEYLEIRINGVPLARVHEFDGVECGEDPTESIAYISFYEFNFVLTDGPISVDIVPNESVAGTHCPLEYLAFTIEYQAVTPTDCNGSGLPDYCDVVLTLSPDTNGNFVPDECEVTDCVADANFSGVVDVNDISFVLFRLGDTGKPGNAHTPGDVTSDGIVDVNDISAVLFRIDAVCK